MNQRIVNFIALAIVAAVALGVGGMMAWRALNPPPAASISNGIQVNFGPPPEAPPGVTVPRPLSASPGFGGRSRATKNDGADKANTEGSK